MREPERPREDLVHVELGSSRESQSSSNRPSPPTAVSINNRIYDDVEEDELDRYRPLERTRAHPRSRARSRSRDNSESRRIKEDYEIDEASDKAHKEDDELEKTRRELEAYRLQQNRLAEIRIELQKQKEAAVEAYKKQQMEKLTKEKLEKEQSENEYTRVREDLRKTGTDDKQAPATTEEEGQVDERTTWTRMSRRHISIETLRTYKVDYDLDQVRRSLEIK